MIRYSYNRQLVPPAPFVHVTIRCLETGKELNGVPAQMDSGADRSVLPGNYVEELGLVQLDEIPVAGFGGHISLIPSYRVALAIHQFPPLLVEVIAHADEPFVLLGRDVLNQFRLLFDGPQNFLEIG
jgi:hypothetical protein